MGSNADDFFNSFDSVPAKPATAVNRRQAPPPPPPPGAGSSTQQRRAAAPPPPPPGARTGTSLRRPQQTSAQQLPPAAAQQQKPQQAKPQFLLNNNNITNNNAGSHGTSYYGNAGGIPSQPMPGQEEEDPQDDFGSDWFAPTQQSQMSSFQPQSVASASAFNSNTQQQQQHYGGGGYGVSSFQQSVSHSAAAPAPFHTFEGSMDASDRSTGSASRHIFVPQINNNTNNNNMNMMGEGDTAMKNGFNDLDDLSNEPPLLEELGINLEHIAMKTKAVVIPFRRFHKDNHTALTDPNLIMADADLAGPLVFALLLGGELMLAGKLQFGYIYGFGVFGCLSMTLVLNLMTPGDTAVSFWTVTSILGYALLPVNILAAVKIILLNLAGLLTLTRLLALLTVFWSTTASTRLLEVGCGMTAQRYLLAYPIALLYSAFVLITIF